MRGARLLLGLVLVLGLTSLTGSASAGGSTCGQAVPHTGYTTAHFDATYSVPMAPCRHAGHPVTLALTVSVTRCVPVVGCGFATFAHKNCRGTGGSCVLTMHASHPALEVASYYVQSAVTVVSGDYVGTGTTSSSGGLPCASTPAEATCG